MAFQALFLSQTLRSRLALFCASVLVFTVTCPAFAIYYQRGPIQKGEHVSTFVEHVRHARFSKGMFGPYMNNKYENGAYFYSGLIHKELAKRSGFGTTFWQGKMDGQVKILNTGSLFFPLSSVSEGASCSAGGNIPFMRENAWYQIVYKIWQPSKGGNSLFGVWIEDVQEGVWYHAVTAQLPVVSSGFEGAGGFLEPLNKDKQVHRMDRRKSYGYISGEGWRSLNQLTVGGGSPDVNNKRYWKILNNDEENLQEIFLALKDESLVPDYNVPHGEKVQFSYKQPEKPTFPELNIASAEVEKIGSQLYISWAMAEGSVPTIDARVELLDSSGEIVESVFVERPYQRELSFTPQAAAAKMRLIVTDIYDQDALLELSAATELSNLTAAAEISANELAQGVEFDYYAPGKVDYTKLADLEVQERTNFGIAPRIDLNIHEGARRKTAFAAKYRGFLLAPKDGFYQFHLRVSDGIRLSLGGQEYIRDEQGGLNAKVLTLPLKKGYHPIEVDYFNSKANEGYLELEWLKPGDTQASVIGGEFLFHEKEGKAAAPELELAIDTQKAPIIRLGLKGEIPEQVQEVRYFASGTLWRKTDTAPFIIEGGAVSGKNQYSAKLYFENGRVWATPAIEYESENLLQSDEEWEYIAKEATAPVSYSFQGGSLSFSGRGTHEFARKVEGDFTLKLRIDKLEGGSDRSFLALGKRKDRFALFASTRQGISIPSHQRNFGGSSYGLPATVKGEEPQAQWICLANKEGRITTYYSYDGKNWTKANEAYFDGGIDEVSIRFESKLSEGEPFLKVALSQIEWVDEFDPALEPKTRQIPLDLTEAAILGLVAGGEDIAFARTKKGLLKTEDFGQTWFAYPGFSVEKADGIIRSLAVSPHNPDFHLIAEIEGGASKLLKTTDGGKNWQQINSPVSFSDDQLSLLSGEIIDFHPVEENFIVIGGREGLFLSRDGGESWELQGLEGKLVSFARWHDASLKLDKGFPLYAASVQESKIHAFTLQENIKTQEITTPAPVLDVKFQPADYVSWFYVATTRGVYETVNSGKKLMQMHSPDPLSLKQDQPGIFDHTITAFALARHSKPSTTQRTFVCFRLKNPDHKKPQASYLKGSYEAALPLKEGELVLKALDHPTAADKGIVGTDQGFYYTQGNRGLYRGGFQPAEVKR